MKNAVVLLSGGLDSATTLAIASRQDGCKCYALSFRYGQRHSYEIEAAERLAEMMSVVEHRVVDLDPRAFAGSALTDMGSVPHGRTPSQISGGDIPTTYVPARNTIFLAFALGWAEVVGAADIYIGVNALDYSGYPDCRPEFIRAFETMARIATKAGVSGERPLSINAPLLMLTKADIIRRGIELGVDYSITRSCYDPQNGAACGDCDSCVLRREGFAKAGVADPTIYAAAR